MLRGGALAPPGRYGRDIRLDASLLRAVGARGQLDQSVQRDLHPGGLFLGHVQEIRVDTAQDGLVRDNKNVLATLELHDDRLEADDDVAVRLSPAVAVVVLVVVASFKVLRVAFRNVLVGQAVAHARVELVEGFPLEFGVAHLLDQVTGGLDGAF